MDIKKVAVMGCVAALAALVPCVPLGIAVFSAGAGVAAGVATGGSTVAVGMFGVVVSGALATPSLAAGAALAAVPVVGWGLLAIGAVLA